MLAESFRLVTARLIPRELRCKRTLLVAVVIVAGFGLAGCGSGTTKAQDQWQAVRGTGFSFRAPAGWKVERAQRRVSVTHGSALVQVSTFPLMKAYAERLFGRVATELRSRMQDIARQTGGKLGAEQTITAAGIRSHAYEVTAGSRVDQYTFVLSGKREYLLLCRRTSSDGLPVCAQLVTSFARR
jgi:hypothetical protein